MTLTAIFEGHFSLGCYFHVHPINYTRVAELLCHSGRVTKTIYKKPHESFQMIRTLPRTLAIFQDH